MKSTILLIPLSLCILLFCSCTDEMPVPPLLDNEEPAWGIESIGEYRIYPLGDYNVGLHFIAVDSSGKYAYVTNSREGLTVLDISDPVNPRLSGNYANLGDVNVVEVSRDYAYLADFTGALRIMDIRRPLDLELVGSYETSLYAPNWYPFSMTFSDETIFLGCGRGLMVFDVSSPAAPRLAGIYNRIPNHVNGVVADGDLVYLVYSNQNGLGSNFRSGLMILDVSDPSNIVEVGSFDNGNTCWYLAKSDDIVYVTQDYDGVLQLDVSDPTIPSELGLYHRQSTLFHRLYCDDRYLYISGWYGTGVFIYSARNPMQLLAYHRKPGRSYKGVMPVPGTDDMILTTSLSGYVEILKIN